MPNQNQPAQPDNNPKNPHPNNDPRINFAEKNNSRYQRPSQNPQPQNPNQNRGQNQINQQPYQPNQTQNTRRSQTQQAQTQQSQQDQAGRRQNQQTQQYQQNQQTQPPNQNRQTNNQQADSEYFPNVVLEESRIAPGIYKPLPEEKILTWQAPSRPFKKRNKKYFSTVAVIALLVALILGFAGQLVAVTVVIAVAFLVYALSVIPPQDVTYQISTYGIRIENSLYYWEELGRFWFTDKYDQEILNIETIRFPGRITLLLGDQDKDLIDQILSEVLLHQKPEPTLYEKVSDWLQEKIPLDTEN